MFGFPLLLIPLAICNIIVFLMPTCCSRAARDDPADVRRCLDGDVVRMQCWPSPADADVRGDQGRAPRRQIFHRSSSCRFAGVCGRRRRIRAAAAIWQFDVLSADAACIGRFLVRRLHCAPGGRAASWLRPCRRKSRCADPEPVVVATPAPVVNREPNFTTATPAAAPAIPVAPEAAIPLPSPAPTPAELSAQVEPIVPEDTAAETKREQDSPQIVSPGLAPRRALSIGRRIRRRVRKLTVSLRSDILSGATAHRLRLACRAGRAIGRHRILRRSPAQTRVCGQRSAIAIRWVTNDGS